MTEFSVTYDLFISLIYTAPTFFKQRIRRSWGRGHDGESLSATCGISGCRKLTFETQTPAVQHVSTLTIIVAFARCTFRRARIHRCGLEVLGCIRLYTYRTPHNVRPPAPGFSWETQHVNASFSRRRWRADTHDPVHSYLGFDYPNSALLIRFVSGISHRRSRGYWSYVSQRTEDVILYHSI